MALICRSPTILWKEQWAFDLLFVAYSTSQILIFLLGPQLVVILFSFRITYSALSLSQEQGVDHMIVVPVY